MCYFHVIKDILGLSCEKRAQTELSLAVQSDTRKETTNLTLMKVDKPTNEHVKMRKIN